MGFPFTAEEWAERSQKNKNAVYAWVQKYQNGTQPDANDLLDAVDALANAEFSRGVALAQERALKK